MIWAQCATSVETVRAGTVARAHERLCGCGRWALPASDPHPVPLYHSVQRMRHDAPELTVAEALAVLRECDAW